MKNTYLMFADVLADSEYIEMHRTQQNVCNTKYLEQKQMMSYRMNNNVTAWKQTKTMTSGFLLYKESYYSN